MAPTIKDGDSIRVEATFDFARFDIVLYRPPDATTESIVNVGRLVGLPGDEIEIRAGRLIINGRPVEEPYVLEHGDGQFGPIMIGDGWLAILGDNRRDSQDSRHWGLLDEEEVLGIVTEVVGQETSVSSTRSLSH